VQGHGGEVRAVLSTGTRALPPACLPCPASISTPPERATPPACAPAPTAPETLPQVLGEFATGMASQQQHLEALDVLDVAMEEFAELGNSFAELCLYVYHPDYCPMESYSYLEPDGMLNMRTERIHSDIREDGSVMIVADKCAHP
jgi:hypothetical protein